MAAQCESAAPPPSNRPEALRPPMAFILEKNTPAGGSRINRESHAWQA